MNNHNIDYAGLLMDLIAQGKITHDDVAIEMRKRIKEVIAKYHPFAITQGADGRWRTYIREQGRYKNRRQIAKSTREDLELYLYDVYTGADEQRKKSGITLTDLYPEWLDYKRMQGTAETTINKYNTDWSQHIRDTVIAKKPICALSKAELEEWAHSTIRDNDMTQKDYINVSTIVKQSLDFAIRQGVIDHNLMREVVVFRREYRPVHKKTSESQVFMKSELLLFRKVAWSDVGNKRLVYPLSPLAVLLMSYTALRISEVSVLKFSDIEGDVLHVQRMYQRDTHSFRDTIKGSDDERFVPLTTEAKRVIDLARKAHSESDNVNDELIFSLDGKSPYRTIASRYERYCNLAGIPKKSSHKMRKTVLTALVDSGMSLEIVRKIAGHKDQSTLLESYVYSWDDTKNTQSEMEKILDIG